jgi:triacylglycerol lipase
MLHRLYFSPGMFGFGRLASYDYFEHLERELTLRLRAAGDHVVLHVAQVSPTASIRRRAATLTELVASTCDLPSLDGGPIHLIGHSTGGLDARLVASPSVSLPVGDPLLAWRPRLASVTTINTPHYGTPLASFFTTVSGQNALRALSALTFIALSFGAPPLSAVRSLVGAFGRADRSLGFESGVLDRTTDALLRVLDDARSRDVRAYVDLIKEDQGAMVQLMPEAMDLFEAGVEDRPGVLYQSTASMAPAPSAGIFVRSLAHPWSALSGVIFTMLYGISSRYDKRYPCAAAAFESGTDGRATEQNEQVLTKAFGRPPGARANDGVVPIRSQLWGQLVWAGYGDHLDVLGHFRDDAPDGASGGLKHVDWLSSGSTFHRARFASLVDAIASGLLEGARRASAS